MIGAVVGVAGVEDVDAVGEHEIHSDFEENWRPSATFSIRGSSDCDIPTHKSVKTVNERMSGSTRVGVWVCVSIGTAFPWSWVKPVQNDEGGRCLIKIS